MTKLKRAAMVAELVDRLRKAGSWAGETHIQKACYLLQHLYGVPLEFSFVLYRHGPFSFDLRDELTAMRADRLLNLEPQPIPYGPKMATTACADQIRRRFYQTLGDYDRQLTRVASVLGSRGVAELERLATALYVRLEDRPSPTPRAKRLVELKPHIGLDDAHTALEEIDRLSTESRPTDSPAGRG